MAIVYEKQKITLGFKKDKPEVYRIKRYVSNPSLSTTFLMK